MSWWWRAIVPWMVPTRTSLKGVKVGQRVRFEGTLAPEGAPLVAPLTGRSCVFYHVVLREGPSGRELAYERRVGDFVLVDDEGGRILVRGEGARVKLVWRRAHLDSGSTALASPLFRTAWQADGSTRDEPYAYEWILPVGARAQVEARVVSVPDPRAGAEPVLYREAPQRLELHAADRGGVRVQEIVVGHVGILPER